MRELTIRDSMLSFHQIFTKLQQRSIAGLHTKTKRVGTHLPFESPGILRKSNYIKIYVSLSIDCDSAEQMWHLKNLFLQVIAIWST